MVGYVTYVHGQIQANDAGDTEVTIGRFLLQFLPLISHWNSEWREWRRQAGMLTLIKAFVKGEFLNWHCDRIKGKVKEARGIHLNTLENVKAVEASIMFLWRLAP